MKQGGHGFRVSKKPRWDLRLMVAASSRRVKHFRAFLSRRNHIPSVSQPKAAADLLQPSTEEQTMRTLIYAAIFQPQPQVSVRRLPERVKAPLPTLSVHAASRRDCTVGRAECAVRRTGREWPGSGGLCTRRRALGSGCFRPTTVVATTGSLGDDCGTEGPAIVSALLFWTIASQVDGNS